jgi:hypothetical protein
MRICPACGDPVAGTPRWCPRCTAPLPEPGTAAGPGTVTWPGIVTWSGYPGASGYRPDSGYPAEHGYPTGPEYPAEPGYPTEPDYAARPGYPADPGYWPPGVIRRGWDRSYAADPDTFEPYSARPGGDPRTFDQPAPDQPAPYLSAPYQPDAYLPARYERGLHERGPYGPGPYYPDPDEPGPHEPGPYEPRHDEPNPYEQADYHGDVGRPEPIGDLFAGGPETRGFPVLPAPEPDVVPEQEDTAARLLYPPPSLRRRMPGRRTQVTSAALAAVALLVGGVTAWAAFGQPQAGPGSQPAGRPTTAARRASPAPTVRPVPSPAPSVTAPGGAPAVVTMAPGMSQAPDAAQVDGFLVSYFTAINAHDYQQYERLLIPARRAQLTAADFARGYGTTTDTGASIVGISPTGQGVAATVTFTSQQRVAPGADVTGCTYWDITLYLQKRGGTLLIASPPRGYHAYHRSCP